MMSLLLGSQSGLPSSSKERKERNNDIMPPKKCKSPRCLRMIKMMPRPFPWVFVKKKEAVFIQQTRKPLYRFHFSLHLHSTPTTLDDESQNTSTNSHDASTKLHSSTSSSSSLATSASRRSSSRTRRISIGSSNIAVCSQQSTTALLGNSLNGLEIGGRAVGVLKQAGCAGCEEGL